MFWKWRNRTTGGKKNIFHLFFWLNLLCSVMSGNSSVTELPGLDQHPSTYSPFSKGKRLRVQPIRARHDVSYQWRSVWRVQPGIFHLCESLKETNQKHEQPQKAMVSQLLRFCTSEQKFIRVHYHWANVGCLNETL